MAAAPNHDCFTRYVCNVVVAAAGGQNTVLKLTIRRLFCDDADYRK